MRKFAIEIERAGERVARQVVKARNQGDAEVMADQLCKQHGVAPLGDPAVTVEVREVDA